MSDLDLVGKAVRDDELLHLVVLFWLLHRDVHRHARLLDVGVEPFERDQHGGDIDLIGDQRRHVGRAAHQDDRLRLDVVFLEVAEIAARRNRAATS